MKHFCTLLLISSYFLLVTACHSKNDEHEFDRLYLNYKKGMTELFPFWAAQNLNSFSDEPIPIPNEISRTDQLLFCTYYLDSLNQLNANQLSATQQKTLEDTKKHLEQLRWEIVILKAHEWNPSIYNIELLFTEILENKAIELRDRLLLIHKKAKSIPAYYEAAKDNLQKPPADFIEQAIKDHIKAFDFFDRSLTKYLAEAKLSDIEKANFIIRNNKSKIAIKDFIAFCNSLKFEINNELLEM